MNRMLGIDCAGVQSPFPFSKEMAIAYQSTPFSEGPKHFSDLLIALSYVLDVQEDPHFHHGWRVAALSAAMAKHLIPHNVTDVFFAGLLHDVGCIGQFSHMAHHPDADDQRSTPEIVAHPRRSAEVIRAIPGLELAAEIAADHHEWWNGCGYPSRKEGSDIHPGSQLIRLADSLDLGRKLRLGVTAQQAVAAAEIISGVEVASGVVDAFRAAVADEDFHGSLIDDTSLLLLIQKIQSSLILPAFRPYSDVTGQVLGAFAQVIDAKHNFTVGHSQRVALYSLELGRTLELPHNDMTTLRFSALLHDAGMVAVSKSIVGKPGPLSPMEYRLVRNHPVLTRDIILNIAQLSELAWIASHHHERWDGLGYPDGLRGEEIPLLSRVLAVADAVDAITSPRPYRDPKCMADALLILREVSGTQFDPLVVDAARKEWSSLR